MKLGEFFTLAEMTRTNTGFNNAVRDNQILVNLTRLVSLVLDPLRYEVGRIDVTSGYRSGAVNKSVGGAAGSYHLQGLAADIVSPDLHIIEVADRIKELGLPYDKLIMEYHGPNDQWIHVQIKPAGEGNRYQTFTAALENGEMVYTEVA